MAKCRCSASSRSGTQNVPDKQCSFWLFAQAVLHAAGSSLSGQGWGPLSLPPFGDPGGMKEHMQGLGIMDVPGEASQRLLLLLLEMRRVRIPPPPAPAHRQSHLRNNNLNQTALCATHCSESIN